MLISRRFNQFLLAAAMALLTCAPSQRATAQVTHDGPYAGVGLAYSIAEFSGFALASHAEDSFGLDIRGGYRWSHVAAEFAIQYFPSFDIHSEDETLDDEKILGLLVGPNVKAYPFTTGSIQPYALVGLGFTYADSDANLVDYNDIDLMFRFGAGIELYFTDRISIYGEGFYSLPIGRETDMIPFMGGIQFHFGGPTAAAGGIDA